MLLLASCWRIIMISYHHYYYPLALFGRLDFKWSLWNSLSSFFPPFCFKAAARARETGNSLLFHAATANWLLCSSRGPCFTLKLSVPPTRGLKRRQVRQFCQEVLHLTTLIPLFFLLPPFLSSFFSFIGFITLASWVFAECESTVVDILITNYLFIFTGLFFRN